MKIKLKFLVSEPKPPLATADARCPMTQRLATTSPAIACHNIACNCDFFSKIKHHQYCRSNYKSRKIRGTTHVNNGQRHTCHGQIVTFKCQQLSTDAKISGASSTAAAHGATPATPSNGSESSRLRTAALWLQRRARLTAAVTLRAPQRRHGFRMLPRTEPFKSILPHIACLDRAEAIINTQTKESTELMDFATN